MEGKGCYLEAYTQDKRLAKDVCWAMALGHGTTDVMVTHVKGFGWHIDCACKDEWSKRQVWSLLGEAKTAKVNWL